MHIFIDFRAPEEAKRSLSKYGKVVEFRTEKIVYASISGHPDIFIAEVDGKYIIAPNVPENYLDILANYDMEIGEKKVGEKYPETVCYNALVTKKYLIHRKGLTDLSVLKNAMGKEFLSVPQGYTRCSLIELDGLYITSDMGIYTTLKEKGLDSFFVDPRRIVLPGCKYGFVGGTAGIFEKKVFFIGNLSSVEWGKQVKNIINNKGYQVIELYNGPLYDGGGIFFFT